MERRPATAPPILSSTAAVAAQRIGGSRSLTDRRLRGISKLERCSPDSIEETAAGLFARVRALIDQSYPVSGETALRDTSDHSRGYSTSSYDGDEGTPVTSSSGTSRDPVRKIKIDMGTFDDTHSSSSSIVSSPEATVRIQTVPHHSVTNSIVRNDSPMPAYFLHSSNPTNIHNLYASPPEAATSRSARSLAEKVRRKPIPGHHAPSSVSGAGDDALVREIRRKPLPRHYPRSSTSDISDEIADGGVDPEKIREQVLSRRPFSPIPIIDPIFSVVYDSSGSSRDSQFRALDLFPRPLILGRQPPKSPANTLTTPGPLISVIPPTPVVGTSATNSPDMARTRQEARVHSNTVLAHTGASTPEESIIQPGDSGIGSPTAEKGTMTDIEYDEDDYEENEELETLPEISIPATSPERFPNTLEEDNPKDHVSSEKTPQIQMPGFYTKSQLDELAVYSDSDINVTVRKHTPRTLYEEYVLSDPRRRKSESNRPRNAKLRSGPQSRHQSASREREEARLEQTLLPMSTGSFTRIITDLEDMLNQALELAGRAVIDSHTALEQRDASIRSARSLRESILGDGESIIGNATAESFRTANDQQAVEGVSDERGNPAVSSVLRKQLTRGSTLAVYQDDGERTSDAEDGEDENIQKRGRTSHSQSGSRSRRRQSAPASRRADVQNTEELRSMIPRPTRHSTLNSVRGSRAVHTGGHERKFQLWPEMDTPKRKLRVHQPPPGLLPTKLKEKGGWDWSLPKKRYAASVHCGVVILLGFIIGCYGGETTAIKASLGITTSLTLMGNVLFILGVAIPSLLFWPLSLLHGRKPYVLLSIALTIPLQLPQALSLPPHTMPSQERSMVSFVVCILVFRAISGFVLGFATMNVLATLIDLFGPDTGACCRGGVVFNSSAPVEGQDQFHLVPGGEAGARIGIWLGVWVWVFFAFGGVGYVIGQLIISRSSPAWGFWIVAIVATVLLLLVWLLPEVRPPWRKQRLITRRRAGWKGDEEKRHEDRGEIMMVVSGTSPKWWWEEVCAGVVLSWRMCNQLGFLVMATYVGWIAGEVTMVFNLLIVLESGRYSFTAVDTGLAVLALSVGALLSVPVQLSTFYLRNFRHRVHHRAHPEARHHYHEGQHPYRAVFFISIFLVPAASLAFTVSATGPPIHFVVPIFFAGLVAFSGTLAIAECHLIVMENFDTSNLPEPLLPSGSGSGSTSYGDRKGGRPHGTQRPSSLVGSNEDFITCHPAITAAFGIFQFVSLASVAGAVGWSRYIAEGIGVRYGLGIFTGITFLATIALVGVLWRWNEVRVLEVYADQDSEYGTGTGITEEVRVCKISILQKGQLTRWSEVNGMVYRGDEEVDVWRVRGAG